MMNARRLSGRLLAVCVLLVAAAAIAWGLAPRPVPVDVRTVGHGQLTVCVNDDGVTRIRERYVIRAPLGGLMRRVRLHVGDAVQANDTVITSIDPPDPTLLDPRAEADARARLETAKAVRDLADKSLDRARVQVEYTLADLERAKQLFPTKAVTHEQLDAAERAWKTAIDDLAEAEQEVHVAAHLVQVTEAALVRSRPRGESDSRAGAVEWGLDVTSPIDGRVLRVIRESEGRVEAGAELVEVGDPRDLEAVIDLVSEDAVKVVPGHSCELTAWGGDAQLVGHVRAIEPRGFTKVSPLGVEEQRVNVIVDLDTAAAARPSLGDDFRVEAAITIDTVHDAILVPLAAVFRHGEGQAVFVVANGRAQLVRVRIGRRSNREAEVLDGLTGGETVIAYPSDTVTEGTRVTPR